MYACVCERDRQTDRQRDSVAVAASPLLPFQPLLSRLLLCVVLRCCCATSRETAMCDVRGFEQNSSLPPPPPPRLHTYFLLQARVSLEGVSLSLSDIRIVDGKFACYRITVTPATGAGWEVRLGWDWRLWWVCRQLCVCVCVCVCITSGGVCVIPEECRDGAASCCRGRQRIRTADAGPHRRCATRTAEITDALLYSMVNLCILCTLNVVLDAERLSPLGRHSSVGSMIPHPFNSTTAVLPADAFA